MCLTFPIRQHNIFRNWIHCKFNLPTVYSISCIRKEMEIIFIITDHLQVDTERASYFHCSMARTIVIRLKIGNTRFWHARHIARCCWDARVNTADGLAPFDTCNLLYLKSKMDLGGHDGYMYPGLLILFKIYQRQIKGVCVVLKGRRVHGMVRLACYSRCL